MEEEDEDGSTRLNFNLLPRLPKLVCQVELSEGLGWVKEDSIPSCNVMIALTPDLSAYPQWGLQMPVKADIVTITGAADTGLGGFLLRKFFNIVSSCFPPFFT